MAIVINDEYAEEKDTFGITVAFTDGDNSGVTPNAGLNWSLVDGDGTVINNRTAITISPASSVLIVLSGNDLQFQSDESTAVKRHLHIAGTYDSLLFGSGVSLNKEVQFTLHDTSKISNS